MCRTSDGVTGICVMSDGKVGMSAVLPGVVRDVGGEGTPNSKKMSTV